MKSVAFVFLGLACTIFGTTSEPDHAHVITKETAIYRINPKLSHSYYGAKRKQTTALKQHAIKARGKRETNDDVCEPFNFKEGTRLSNPRYEGEHTYANRTTCFTTIDAGDAKVVVLTFVDEFKMEDPIPRSDPPLCKYDYIEIRDGQFGYALKEYRFCGKTFPPTIRSSTPYLWLKFHSDDTIQYSGFNIDVEFQTNVTSRYTPAECFISIRKVKSGVIDSINDAKKCRELTTAGWAVDIQWRIETPPGTQIYLNFTHYKLAKPNECDANVVQVFGAESNFDHVLGSFCGSVPASVTTKPAEGNIMYIRMFTKDKSSNITAQFTAFRTMVGDEEKCAEDEFNCLDGTCIDGGLRCDTRANCRLKADEDPAICKTTLRSEENDPRMILIVFSVILSMMITVFLVKCILKVYLDQKQINEHLLNSAEGMLDKLSENNLTSDPSRLTLDYEHRASLERENNANEMYKQQRNKQKSSSIETDFLRPSTSPDPHDWPESVPILPEDIRIEHKGRTRRSDISRNGESVRNTIAEEEEWQDKRDEFVALDTQEFGCQTRESLYQVDPAPGSGGTNSGSNSRGLSTFGYSPATIARPSPRLSTINPSQVVIQPISSHTDRRPMSSETTRSAPDVIIVSRPIH